MLEKKYAISPRGIIYKTNDLVQIFIGVSHLTFWFGILTLFWTDQLVLLICGGSLVVGLTGAFVSSLLTKE